MSEQVRVVARTCPDCSVRFLASVQTMKDHRKECRMKTTKKPESPYATLIAIQDILDGEWTPQTLEDIAAVMVAAGYEIRDRKGGAPVPVCHLHTVYIGEDTCIHCGKEPWNVPVRHVWRPGMEPRA